ncbi:MAG: hypothetical protein EAZ79_13330 [Oscillatoriales cyanobacterium]|nr:MAG: hypothetical protein EAZ79_13330 [Oscillatoriales cyanobacterium]TAF30097.1 MAG: hypothetical protein EAZ69_23815 [Oscillatoriales cyanobacterium]
MLSDLYRGRSREEGERGRGGEGERGRGGEENFLLLPCFERTGGRKLGFFAEILLLRRAEMVKKQVSLCQECVREFSLCRRFFQDYDRLSTAASNRRFPS